MGKTSPRFPPSPGAAQQILYWVTATTTSHTATDILGIAYTGTSGQELVSSMRKNLAETCGAE